MIYRIPTAKRTQTYAPPIVIREVVHDAVPTGIPEQATPPAPSVREVLHDADYARTCAARAHPAVLVVR